MVNAPKKKRSTKPQWTVTVPIKDGFYWLTYSFNEVSRNREPEVVHVYDLEYGNGNVALGNGSTPKLLTFCKKHPEAMWCEVVPPPPFPTEGELT